MRGERTFPVIPLLTGLMLLAWPTLIGFGLAHNSLQWLLPVMALVLLRRLRQARRNAGPMRYVVQCVALAGIALCAASYLLKTHQWLLFYPVVVNLVMLAVFGGSLWTAMPLVERLARLRKPNLPPAGMRYTRKVTVVWCGFFTGNGAMALFTVLHGDMHLWTLWNGMVAYILMGTLMATEWLVRQRVIKKEMHND
ncbi:DNA gyrase subunit B [Salmonella enterica subsp. enterica serovar Give]|nr:DNA gyrase subunit B [Salmonella enterica]EBM9948339.1 DNA gyrase subunit B [Salmonella enterica subsp. enterica serovar Give]ECG1136118.1 DNA gyrase subunit B [Salmonella enterica subsp. enterica]ECI4632487.1 DNA gyrase subunit B [Salmonella enterica subsp. enterica serovar Hartford]EBC0166635.1 DNA gyrase subunit B [Salmonella enterica]